MPRRPVIGITSYARERVSEVDSFNLPCGYVDSVRAAGGVAVVFPAGEAEPSELLDHVDGLILAGGGDVSPAAYGGKPHETIYSVSEERDEFEFSLARAALSRERPLLCICRGMQVLNVVAGGTLHAHVPETFGEQVAHRQPPKLTSCHPVRLEPSRRLAELLGVTETEVCSWHHQALDRIGRDLRAVAWAEDGLVEAVEHTGHTWCVGVQWHPEMQPGDRVQEKLFAAFVAAAHQKAKE